MIWKSDAPSMAERKRRLVREELGEVALRLLAAQGFEGTTVEQIVAQAGVSRRTFFRYFKSKEDVIIEFLGDLGAFVRAELAARPASETPLTALRNALAIAVELMCEHPEKSLPLTRLTVTTPALRGRYLDRQVDLQAGLAEELARRAGAEPGDRVSQLAAAVGLKAFDLAIARWVETGGTEDLTTLLDEHFALLAHLR